MTIKSPHARPNRKHRLIDCNPRWAHYHGADKPADGITFDCPEGHASCKHTVPFTPALDGTPMPVVQHNGAHWHRKGDTFETITLSPSIRAIPIYESKEEAIRAGAKEEYMEERWFCRFHGFIDNGKIWFCSDSR